MSKGKQLTLILVQNKYLVYLMPRYYIFQLKIYSFQWHDTSASSIWHEKCQWNEKNVLIFQAKQHEGENVLDW